MEIWKYKLFASSLETFNLPKDYKFLCLQMQDGVPCVWVEVNPATPKKEVSLVTFYTGEVIPPQVTKYVGTYQLKGLVFHVYEQPKVTEILESVEGICLECKEHCEVNEDGTSSCCGGAVHVD